MVKVPSSSLFIALSYLGIALHLAQPISHFYEKDSHNIETWGLSQFH